MAFKAESDDTRSSLSYKLKRLLRFRAARVLCTDPYAQHDVGPLAARRRARRVRSARDRDAAPAVRRSRGRRPDRRRVEPAGQRRAGVTPRVSVVIPVYNEGDGIVTCLDRLVDAITLPFEILVVFDSPDDTTRAVRREVRARSIPRIVPTLNTLRPRPGVRDPLRHRRTRPRRSSWSRWPTAPTTRRRSTTLARLIERGVVVAAASRYMPGGPRSARRS